MATIKIVFPQADSINKIIRIISSLDPKMISNKEYIMSNFGIVYRQAQYYIDAIRFLGIIDNENNITDVGVFVMESKVKNIEICHILRNLIVNKPVFKDVYEYVKKHHSLPDKKHIASLIMNYFGLSYVTSMRRTSTVISWINWAIDII